jgi:predicted HTH transcriptional regulator
MRITYEMIPQLIVDGRESDWLEFKAEMYSTSKHSSLIKDIMSMANSMNEGNKYIITGVNLLPDGRRDLCGIGTPSSDDATFQQLILNNIEPDIKFSYSTMNIENEYFGVLEIEDTSNRPYILKKDNDGLKAGECFMRKGSQQCRALRRDYDNFYYMQHRVIMEILDPCLSAMNVKRGGEIKVQFSNYSKLPLTLMHGELVVQDEDKQPVSRHFAYGFEDE